MLTHHSSRLFSLRLAAAGAALAVLVITGSSCTTVDPRRADDAMATELKLERTQEFFWDPWSTAIILAV